MALRGRVPGYRMDYYAAPHRNEWTVDAYDRNHNAVGRAQFVAGLREPQEGEDPSHLVQHGLKAWQVDVHPEHRRKGLATAMYAYAKRKSGMDIERGDFETPAGEAFGKSRRD